MNAMDIILRLGFGGIICILTLMLIHAVSNYFRKRARSDQGSSVAVGLARPAQTEERQHPRVDLSWPVKIKTQQGAIKGETKNISLGGAFICCNKPLPLREVFRLTINAPNYKPLTVNAEVVWSNINVPNEQIVNRGMGIRFIQIKKEDLEFLKELIAARFKSLQ